MYILQHPSEVKQAKGTVRLVSLCMPDAVVVQGECEADFKQLKSQLLNDDKPCYLVYPNDNSKPLEDMSGKIDAANLIFIDGSWKKAFKIYQLNPWLKHFPALHFSAAEKTAYKIRKAPRADSLSTLEAVAWCLENLDNCNTQPLYRAFEAMIDGQWRFMSAQVKERY